MYNIIIIIIIIMVVMMIKAAKVIFTVKFQLPEGKGVSCEPWYSLAPCIMPLDHIEK
jgi:hypothetical protein